MNPVNIYVIAILMAAVVNILFVDKVREYDVSFIGRGHLYGFMSISCTNGELTMLSAAKHLEESKELENVVVIGMFEKTSEYSWSAPSWMKFEDNE